MAFSPEQCILVFDDLDLPLGAVKTRIKGGAGGHRGVASILEAFQTDAIRRVKIGVGKAGEKLDRVTYVPVSYTHLDVYKRQGQTFWLARLAADKVKHRYSGAVTATRPARHRSR